MGRTFKKEVEAMSMEQLYKHYVAIGEKKCNLSKAYRDLIEQRVARIVEKNKVFVIK